MIRERFAPSPSGYLHLGHAYSALCAYRHARNAAGDFLLRIEDIDQTRCKPAFEQAIYEDLDWLGLSWAQPVMRQSDRMAAYRLALGHLRGRSLIYACTCQRSDIRHALSAQQEGETHGSDGLIYPGTCRDKGMDETHSTALRLNIAAALPFLPAQISYREIGAARAQSITYDRDHLPKLMGDVVLARKDIGTSYHLSVCVDDAAQGITHITRGQDMRDATLIHRVLQILLDLPEPIYRHHRLIRDETGKRLAKRDDARAIRTYRKNGYEPSHIWQLLGI